MPAPTAPVDLIRTELPFPSEIDNQVLAGVAETVTVPANVSWVWICVTALCYIRTGGTAAVPAGDVTDLSGSFPVNVGNGLFLNVRAITSFSIIGTAVVGLAWYRDRDDGILR